MKKLIDQFNHLDVSLVISDYPDSTVGGGKNYGIAWYTKETLEPLAKRYNRRFVVLGKNIIYFSHNVVTSFDGIGTHLNLGTNPVKLALLNSLLKIYYRVLGLICNRVVVMDTILKKRLSQFVSEDKIVLS